MKKRILCMALAVVLFLGLLPYTTLSAQAASQRRLIHLYVMGVDLTKSYGTSFTYVDENGRTMVPLRGVGEAMGMDVQWNAGDGSIVIEGGDHGTVRFQMGSTRYTVDGQVRQMDTVPVLYKDRTLIPLRFAVESLGGIVYYSETGKDAAANTSEKKPVVEVYYHTKDVTPTAPSWAGDDYVTFERTSVYSPEHWAKILELREKAERGEDIGSGISDFFKSCCSSGANDHYDPGAEYEMLLIEAMIAKNGQPSRSSLGLHFSTNTPEQEASIYRWAIRKKAYFHIERERSKDSIYLGLFGLGTSVGTIGPNDCVRYDPANARKLGISAKAFSNDPWLRDLGGMPYLIFFDNQVFDGEFGPQSVYVKNGTTYVSLDTIGTSLGLKRYSDDFHVTGTSISWAKEEKDASGAPIAVEIDAPQGRIRVVKNSSSATVDGRSISMGAAVQGDKDRLYVPISFLTDVLGENVRYDDDNRTWFVTRNHGNVSQNLVDWTLGMCAVLAEVGDGDPYYFGYYTRCMDSVRHTVYDSPYDPTWPRFVYSYLPGYNISKGLLEQSWGCTSGADIKRQAELLVSQADEECPAWDLFRVAHIASWGYSAGYLTAQEALDLVKPAAQELRDTYTNWDAAYGAWLSGYLAWGGSQEDYQARKEAYARLKAEQDIYGPLFKNELFTQPVG